MKRVTYVTGSCPVVNVRGHGAPGGWVRRVRGTWWRADYLIWCFMCGRSIRGLARDFDADAPLVEDVIRYYAAHPKALRVAMKGFNQ